MLVTKKNVRMDAAPCNFCDRGVLNKYGIGFNYPYEHTFEFKREGSGMLARICDDCLKELNIKIQAQHKNE